MKSLRFTAFGAPSVLRFDEVAIPEPGEGEALVRVKAAAINPSDIGNVAGRFKNTTLPRTPGRDFAGIAVKGMQREGAEDRVSLAVKDLGGSSLKARTSYSRRSTLPRMAAWGSAFPSAAPVSRVIMAACGRRAMRSS
jgi:NADPH:quinone reductase-like Zn-dependent oxidoreductase